MSEPAGADAAAGADAGATDDGGRAAARAPAREALAVRVHGTEFGLRIEEVREVVAVPRITRLPLPGPAVCGVCSLHGEIVPVVDLGVRLLGRELERPGRMAVVEDPATGGPVALLVDAVAGLVELGAELDELPAEVEASLPVGWIETVIAPAPDRLVTLLKLAPVLALREPSPEERA